MKLISYHLLLLMCAFGIASCSEQESSNFDDPTWEHLAASIEYNNQATLLANAEPASAVVDPKNLDEMKRLWRLALAEAQLVTASVLNEDEHGFGDRYKSEFQRGLELVSAESNEGLVEGQLLLDRFGNYYEELLARKRSR
ncbi:MAG: hypothetical protein IT445_03155 [Phycisphaeraceae bacterium]|nr:hypothetical protein [Phycisphaeraceae bacterium]